MQGIKVVAFDVFGTVLDMTNVDRSEIRSYVANSRDLEEWRPLVVPRTWLNIPAWPDAKQGIARLRSLFKVVTLSNGPVWFQDWVLKSNGLVFDRYIPIEMIRGYKPASKCYQLCADLMGVQASEVLMVTANPTFGDLQGAESVGMPSQVIRYQQGEFAGVPKDIIELAERMGC